MQNKMVIALFCLAAAAGHAQTVTHNAIASQFNNWRVNGNQNLAVGSNTLVSFTPCAISAGGANFNAVSASTPLKIYDPGNPAVDEILTPTAIVVNSNGCTATLSPANIHTQPWYIGSGTYGLQEAINAYATTNSNNQVIVDSTWYTAGGTPAMIRAAVGSNSLGIQDVTKIPNTSYAYDGAAYVLTGASPGIDFNQRVSSFTNISAPVAISTSAATNGLLTTAATGGTISNATYRLGFTYVDSSGQETTLSIDTASTATIATTGTTSTISVTSPAAATGAVGYRLYMTAASGASLSEILYSPTCTPTTLQNVLPSATVCAIGSTATITAVVTGTATVPVVNTAYPRLASKSGSFPPFPALGTIATTVVGNLATINIPAGYMNTLGRQLTLCGNGYATTNGTGGTITLASTLASLVGTTSITPFTVVSPSIAASAIQVPINFCETWTTAATGATGTLEAHGWVDYGVAGTAVGSLAQDIIFAVSSAIDLTKQDQIAITIKPTTAGLTAAQLRQLSIIPIT